MLRLEHCYCRYWLVNRANLPGTGANLRGMIGSGATFHSMYRNARKHTPPVASVLITIGESHA